ncbi:hypothetical protein DPMN_142982 [Dreissena polymorpha]|uniref:Uncharacterized protein n=1 Tax=Dreissena polymorpha TaxID=45954 RepID=A0A9D4GFD8_DREPO|nr:hypothetical protein DPMN_142982 [Dreissena polymorpha]
MNLLLFLVVVVVVEVESNAMEITNEYANSKVKIPEPRMTNRAFFRLLSPMEIPMDVTPEVPEATNDISVLSDLSMDSDEVEDRTFNVTNREINQPNVPLDVSLRERPLDTVIPEDGPVTYEVVTGGTKRGGKMLISSDGHSYTAKFIHAIRPDLGGTAICPDIRKKRLKARAEVRSKKNVFEPAASIVEDVLKEMVTTEDVNLVRTNNDVEGWHRRINGRSGRPDLGFYVLVPLLRREAETVDLTIRLVSEHALTRVHRKIFKEVQGRLFEIWEKYDVIFL